MLLASEYVLHCLSVDIDECQSANICDIHAECINTAGNYSCDCNTGYSGDGVNCSG